MHRFWKAPGRECAVQALEGSTAHPMLPMTMEPRQHRRGGPPPTAKGNERPSQWAVSARATTKDLYSDHEWLLLEAAKWEHAANSQTTRRALKASPAQRACSPGCLPDARGGESRCGLAQVPSVGASPHGAGAFRRPRPNHAVCRWLLAPTCVQVVTETTQVAQQTLGGLYEQGRQVQRAQHGVEQVRVLCSSPRCRWWWHCRLPACCFPPKWRSWPIPKLLPALLPMHADRGRCGACRARGHLHEPLLLLPRQRR